MLNPDDIYDEILDNWLTLWDDNLSLFANVRSILKKIILLPNENLLDIIACYCLLSSKWSRVAGILFSVGDPGSGKSTIAKFASYLHGHKNTFSPADTFASIRNALSERKYGKFDKDSLEYESLEELDGCILCWDNLDRATMVKEPRLYKLLLVGYDRATAVMAIAQPDGTNRDFNVYCPKIISSIDPFHLSPDYFELRRRVFLIPHKKQENLLPDEGYECEFLDIDSISWKGIEKQFHEFWSKESVCREYVVYRKSMKRSMKPAAITSEQWTISVDLICTGLVLKAWKNLSEALSCIEWYWNYSKKVSHFEGATSLAHLKEFIKIETENVERINEQLAIANQPLIEPILNPTKLKKYLKDMGEQGRLDITLQHKDINRFMYELGWIHSKEGWIKR